MTGRGLVSWPIDEVEQVTVALIARIRMSQFRTNFPLLHDAVRNKVAGTAVLDLSFQILNISYQRKAEAIRKLCR